MNTKTLPKGFLKFILLILISIGVSYSGSDGIATIWYLGMLAWYYFSKDEAFWLAYFLVIVDGFMGVLGLYSATISLLPGLPAIEVAQFYILITLFKSFSQRGVKPFYGSYIRILFFYAIFLIFWGQMQGFTGEINTYFRIFKLSLPLLLFFSIPRLFRHMETYERFMAFIFPVALLAFVTQLADLILNFSLANYLQAADIQEEDSEIFRSFYNTSIVLLSLFGALLFQTLKTRNYFTGRYLNIIIISCFSMTLLSATRGWILGFGFILIFYFTIINKANLRRIIGFAIALIIVLILGLTNEKIKKQVEFSIDRFETLEALLGGDKTAEGTLVRLDERGPRVMNQWKDNPLLGWGYSDTYTKYNDHHVGNQNILLYSGVIGLSLLIGFFIFFCLRMLGKYVTSTYDSPYAKGNLVFIAFLLGWFMLHSSSGQQFAYLGLPVQMIPQALLVAFGGYYYNLNITMQSKRAAAIKLVREERNTRGKVSGILKNFEN